MQTLRSAPTSRPPFLPLRPPPDAPLLLRSFPDPSPKAFTEANQPFSSTGGARFFLRALTANYSETRRGPDPDEERTAEFP